MILTGRSTFSGSIWIYLDIFGFIQSAPRLLFIHPMNTIVKSCYTIMWLGNSKWLLGSLCNIRIPARLRTAPSIHHWRVPNKPHEYYSMYLYYVISLIYIYIYTSTNKTWAMSLSHYMPTTVKSCHFIIFYHINKQQRTNNNNNYSSLSHNVIIPHNKI